LKIKTEKGEIEKEIKIFITDKENKKLKLKS